LFVYRRKIGGHKRTHLIFEYKVGQVAELAERDSDDADDVSRTMLKDRANLSLRTRFTEIAGRSPPRILRDCGWAKRRPRRD
jgi:hypothetical protein